MILPLWVLFDIGVEAIVELGVSIFGSMPTPLVGWIDACVDLDSISRVLIVQLLERVLVEVNGAFVVVSRWCVLIH